MVGITKQYCTKCLLSPDLLWWFQDILFVVNLHETKFHHLLGTKCISSWLLQWYNTTITLFFPSCSVTKEIHVSFLLGIYVSPTLVGRHIVFGLSVCPSQSLSAQLLWNYWSDFEETSYVARTSYVIVLITREFWFSNFCGS